MDSAPLHVMAQPGALDEEDGDGDLSDADLELLAQFQGQPVARLEAAPKRACAAWRAVASITEALCERLGGAERR